MSTTENLPEAWSDLIKGLTLLARYRDNDISPLHCEHDELLVCANTDGPTPEEMEQLDAWGFFPDADGGFKSFRFGSA